jgi:hypothetical protein
MPFLSDFVRNTLMQNDVQFLSSKLLNSVGVRHGWFMRYGGRSEGLFESLNGKKDTGDSDGNVDENRKRACLELGVKPEGLTHIIHEFKTSILVANQAGEHQGHDASISTRKDQVLSQTTADCGTVIIADNSGSVVAVVHGSWHTLKEEIIRKVITKMKEYTNKDFRAGIGPMICRNCFEFGPEAAELFESKYLEQHGKKYLVDLKQMIIDQLHESGVTEVDDLNVCTLEDERFFSHRRSGAKSGRFITLASS